MIITSRLYWASCLLITGFRYWDWTLDWEDLSLSPVWSGELGFGGNGNKTARKSVGYGHCVTDGRFANLLISYFGTENRTHCLSRGFNKKWQKAEHVRPGTVKDILHEPTYASFNLALEYRSHNAIPSFIRGDFFKVTAPNGMTYSYFSPSRLTSDYYLDPIFFLHHVQLDRLWWTWQQRDPVNRLTEYMGVAGDGSFGKALPSDKLYLGRLGPVASVSDILSTESSVLCYKYP